MTKSLSKRTILLHSVLFLFVVYFTLPLYVIVVTSFKSFSEVMETSIIAPPIVWTLEAWAKAWSTACSGQHCVGVKPYFIETLSIVFPALILCTLSGSMTGYIMAQWRSKFGDILFMSLIMGSFIPLQLYLMPIAITLRELGIFGETIGLILVHTIYGLPLTTMLYRNYYVTLPSELIKAAMMDGAGFFKMFFSVVMPLSSGITIVVVILAFTGIYNDYLFSLVFGEPTNKPIMAAVNSIINNIEGVTEYNVNMAVVMIASLPTLIVYLVAGKFFVRGLTQGAVKG